MAEQPLQGLRRCRPRGARGAGCPESTGPGKWLLLRRVADAQRHELGGRQAGEGLPTDGDRAPAQGDHPENGLEQGVLPMPFLPRSATISPCPTVRDTSFTIDTAPYPLDTSRSASAVPAVRSVALPQPWAPPE